MNKICRKKWGKRKGGAAGALKGGAAGALKGGAAEALKGGLGLILALWAGTASAVMPVGIIALGTMTFFSWGCSKEEPDGEVNNLHKHPDGSEDDNHGGGGNGNQGGGSQGGGNQGGGSQGGGNQGSGGENDPSGEEAAAVRGKWLRSDGLERLEFGQDGLYLAYALNKEGGDLGVMEEGHYKYHDLSRRLWIEIYGEEEDRVVEFRCVFGEDGSLTLWAVDNTWRKFKRL